MDSTVKISDTMEFCKRLSFNRNSGIGNSLEPALTAANLVMQTILSPPFSWWWNSQQLSFTCSTTLPTSPITKVALSGNIVTLDTVNSWSENDILLVSGLTGASFLNSAALTVLTATNTQITAYFNRAASYPSTADTGTLTKTTTQDYVVNIPNFAFIEHASVYDIFTTSSTTGTVGKKWWELEVKNELALDSIQARPQFINPYNEDSNGNVTFRLMPAPSQNYPVAVHVQLAAPQITSLNQTWAPLPDFMQHIYTWGFLSLIWAFADDPRVGYANQKFTSAILARAEGLTDAQVDIFLNNWAMLTGQQQTKFQQGRQALSV